MNEKRKLHPAALIAIVALLAVCLWYTRRQEMKSAQAPGYEYSWLGWDTFDTISQVIGNAESQEEWNRQMAEFKADLTEYNRLYDIYNTYDGMINLASINAMAGQGPLQADERIVDLLLLAKEAYTATNGKMNVAAGAVLNLWHEARTAGLEDPENAVLPDAAALAEAANHCNIDDLIIDKSAGTVELKDPLMRLDVGSIGKGYAVEMCARAAEERGLASASISVGGNIRTIGVRSNGKPWGVGIENPWGEGTDNPWGNSRFIAALEMPLNNSLVTSGSYQRYYTVDGVQYHHIIDLATLAPADYFVSVTILGPDSGMADALSTGLFCLPLEKGMEIVDGLEGYEACWLTADGTTVYSNGMESSIR